MAMVWRHIEGLGWQETEDEDQPAVTGSPVPLFDESAAQSSAFRDSTEADWVTDDDLADMLADGRLIR